MDPQPDQSSDSEPSDDGTVTDAAPQDDEAFGAAPTTDQPAADAYGHPDTEVGDLTSSDVDLSGLTPTSDGDPDDEQDPAVEDVPAGQPGEQVQWDETDPGTPVTQP